jgi:hypothetical protein
MKMTAIPFESMIIPTMHGDIIFHPYQAFMHKNTILSCGHILKQLQTNPVAFIMLLTRAALLRPRGRHMTVT